ncbi:MAG: hypothetical protein ACI9WS_002938 [Paraglaciecola psychrophila]|jgi:uncharacterized protein (TIGR03643 family)
MVLVSFLELPLDQQSRVIEMAWEDRTPFEAIELQFGFSEKNIVQIMQRHLKLKSFKNWRRRVSGRATKHQALRSPEVLRGYCKTQYKMRNSRKK